MCGVKNRACLGSVLVVVKRENNRNRSKKEIEGLVARTRRRTAVLLC